MLVFSGDFLQLGHGNPIVVAFSTFQLIDDWIHLKVSDLFATCLLLAVAFTEQMISLSFQLQCHILLFLDVILDFVDLHEQIDDLLENLFLRVD